MMQEQIETLKEHEMIETCALDVEEQTCQIRSDATTQTQADSSASTAGVGVTERSSDSVTVKVRRCE